MKVPVIRNVACSIKDTFIEDDYYYIRSESEKRLIRRARKPVLIEIVGDSMMPKFAPGDVLLFDMDCEVLSGSVVAAVLNSQVMIKSMLVGDEYIVLFSYNPKYKPYIVTEYDHFFIIGKFVTIFKEV